MNKIKLNPNKDLKIITFMTVEILTAGDRLLPIKPFNDHIHWMHWSFV